MKGNLALLFWFSKTMSDNCQCTYNFTLQIFFPPQNLKVSQIFMCAPDFLEFRPVQGQEYVNCSDHPSQNFQCEGKESAEPRKQLKKKVVLDL